MRTSPTNGFDLRDAVDSIRDAFASRTARPADADHGDIRSAILIELTEEPMHGYQLIQAIQLRSGGAWTPSAGSVYPALQLLADEELVTAAQVGERKVYSLTAAGRLAAADVKHAESPRESQRSAQGAFALTKSGVKLAQAVTQVATSASAEQSERAVAVIDEARRKLYAILAED